MRLEADTVEKIFKDCLFREDEISGEEVSRENLPEPHVYIEGIVGDFALHPERLESHRDEVRELLAELPDPFQKSKGGGWSFLGACDDRHGRQWTGLHQTMGHLFALGMGLGLVECLLPRPVWPALPGGMPYYAVLDDE